MESLTPVQRLCLDPSPRGLWEASTTTLHRLRGELGRARPTSSGGRTYLKASFAPPCLFATPTDSEPLIRSDIRLSLSENDDTPTTLRLPCVASFHATIPPVRRAKPRRKPKPSYHPRGSIGIPAPESPTKTNTRTTSSRPPRSSRPRRRRHRRSSP